jgi:hypothetical protein
MHAKITRKVDKILVRHPSDPRGGSRPLGPLRLLGPSRYFGLPMVNPSRPPLPPNKLYHQPLNYLGYVKDFDPNVHVRVFKATIRTIGEIEEIVNMFSFTLGDIVSN